MSTDREGVLQAANVAALPGFVHGFESRWGSLSEHTETPAMRLHQVHGADVLTLPAERAEWGPFGADEPAERPAADALITDHVGVMVAVSVADCLPVLIADPERGAVAAVHGGWRCLAGGIVGNTIEALEQAFGCRPRDLVVAIGPGIRPCCFEVGDEVIAAFAAAGYGSEARVDGPPQAKPYGDLAAVAVAQATSAGVATAAIEDLGLCTRCNNEWLWSYRADGDAAGRMLCGIARTAA